MNYDRSIDSGRENRGYNNRHSFSTVRESIHNSIASKPFRDEEEKRQIARAKLIRQEQSKTGQLLELGKLCRFVEYFDEISIDSQNIEPVGPINNPKDTESFKKGYESANVLINAGFTKSDYHKFADNYDRKYNNTNSKNR